MLRGVRLAAKLGLTLDPATREPIRRLAPLMERVPPARLFDEMLKLLLSGHASACLRQLREVGLHKGLLPLLDVILEQPLGERFVTLALAQTDERVLADRPVSPAFLFAALLWHEVLAAWKTRQARGERAHPGARGRDGRGARHAVRQARDHAPPHRDHARGVGDAAALREPLRQPRLAAARGAALSHGLRFPRPARGERRSARPSSRPGGAPSRAPTPRRARPCCCRRPGRESAAAAAARSGRRGWRARA